MLRHVALVSVVLVSANLVVPAAHAADSDLSVNARLLVAARNGDAETVDRALKEGASPNARNRLGETVLLIALKKNDEAMARTMLAAGADVNLAAVNGVTPLMAAAHGGQKEIAETLLARGAKVDAVDRLDKNAMTYAAGEGRTDIVTLFVARGVNPNEVYHNDLTALMWAAGNGKCRDGEGPAGRRCQAGSQGQPRQDRARHGARGRPRRRCRASRKGVNDPGAGDAGVALTRDGGASGSARRCDRRSRASVCLSRAAQRRR